MSQFSKRYPILYIPVFTVLFMLVSAALSLLAALTRSWEPIPPPPAAPALLAGTVSPFIRPVVLLVQGQDNQVYAFALDGKEAWSTAVLDGLGSPRQVACQAGEYPFWRWKRPFSGEYQCLQAAYHGEAAGPRYRFVLDQDGGLWVWTEQPGGAAMLYLCGGLGVVLGAACFLAAVLLARRKPA